MYIQPTSDGITPEMQLPRNYAGTAFSAKPDIPEQPQEAEQREALPQEQENEAIPAFAPKCETKDAPKGKGSLFSFLTNSPLLSSFLPPPRKGHEGENDIMQWILVGAVILLLLSDSDDDILPLLLLLLFWK